VFSLENIKKEELEMIARIGDFAKKLIIYRNNLLTAMTFFIYGTFAVSGLLVGFGIFENWIYALMLLVIFCIIGTFLIVKAEILLKESFHILRIEYNFKGPSYEGLRWILFFSAPFSIGYSLLSIIEVDVKIKTYLAGICWYPCLGVSLILSDVFIMSYYIRSKIIITHFHGIAGIAILITTPFVIIYGFFVGLNAVSILATGLMLIIYAFTAVYAWLSAEKIFIG